MKIVLPFAPVSPPPRASEPDARSAQSRHDGWRAAMEREEMAAWFLRTPAPREAATVTAEAAPASDGQAPIATAQAWRPAVLARQADEMPASSREGVQLRIVSQQDSAAPTHAAPAAREAPRTAESGGAPGHDEPSAAPAAATPALANGQPGLRGIAPQLHTPAALAPATVAMAATAPPRPQLLAQAEAAITAAIESLPPPAPATATNPLPTLQAADVPRGPSPRTVEVDEPEAASAPRSVAPPTADVPVRVHVDWQEQAAHVWLGVDQDQLPMLPTLVRQIEQRLQAAGLRLASVVCNGRVVQGRPTPGGKQ